MKVKYRLRIVFGDIIIEIDISKSILNYSIVKVVCLFKLPRSPY